MSSKKVGSKMELLLSAIIMFIAVLGGVVVMALLFPLGLGEKADPFFTPPDTKPDWYFLWVYELFKHVSDYMGILILCTVALGILLLPFIDRSKARTPRARPIALSIGALVLTGILFFSIWGYLSK